jgi:hypothetical protein
MKQHRPLRFVVLAAMGAFYIGYGVANGIGFDLWTSGRLVFRSGPPRLEPTLAVGALAGAFVGVRLGGWRGVLGAMVLPAVGVIETLQYPVNGMIECARGNAAYCAAASDLDFVIPQLWLVPGFVLGTIAALVFRPRIPFRTELEAAGMLALAGPVRYLEAVLPQYVGFLRGPHGELLYLSEMTVLENVTLLVAALFAAMLLLRRASRPRRAGVVLAVAVAILALPELAYQLRYPVSETMELTNRLSGFLAAALILVVTALLGRARGNKGEPAGHPLTPAKAI